MTKKGKLKLKACQIIPIRKLNLKLNNLSVVSVELLPAKESIIKRETIENIVFRNKLNLLLNDFIKNNIDKELRQIIHWLPEK